MREKGAEFSLYRYLDTNGDGTGTKNANGDYSGGEEIFYIAPPAGQTYELERMLIYVQDTGTFDAAKYGNGATLTTGIVVRVANDAGTLLDLTDGEPVKTNTHWGRQCYDVEVKAWGTGDEVMVVRWTFAKSGRPIRLHAGERLEVVLNDALDVLVGHYFQVQGTRK